MFSQACVILFTIGHMATRSLLILVMAQSVCTIGMLSNWEFFPHKAKMIILREVRFNPCEDRLNIQNFSDVRLNLR